MGNTRKVERAPYRTVTIDVPVGHAAVFGDLSSPDDSGLRPMLSADDVYVCARCDMSNAMTTFFSKGEWLCRHCARAESDVAERTRKLEYERDAALAGLVSCRRIAEGDMASSFEPRADASDGERAVVELRRKYDRLADQVRK